MSSESLNNEIAAYLETLTELGLTLGSSLFHQAPDRNAGVSAVPVIVYVTPAVFPRDMQRLVDKLADGATLAVPIEGNLITNGFPGVVDSTGPVTVKDRSLPIVQIQAWGSDPDLVLQMLEKINNRLNQLVRDPAAPLVAGGKWDVEFIETETAPELSGYDSIERALAQARYTVSTVRRY